MPETMRPSLSFKTLWVAFPFFLLTCLAQAEPTITLFAGSGLTQWNGEGRSATETSLDSPAGLSLDREGRVLIADMKLNRILRIGADGAVKSIAGTGFSGFGGDGGQADEAFLSKPAAAIGDASGNLWIADTQNHRIRKVGPDGIIQTIAGNGDGFFGLGSYSGDGGPALSAAFNFPRDLNLLPDGSLLVLDQMNGRIRKVAVDGKVETVIGGNPTDPLALKSPFDFFVDSNAKVWITDSPNDRIVSSTGTAKMNLVMGTRPHPAILPEKPTVYPQSPLGLVMDASGTMYWAEGDTNRVMRFSEKGKISVLFDGPQAKELRERKADKPELGRASNLLLLPDGGLLVSDNAKHCIWKISDFEEE